ncbi:uncharacterized protein [Clytia hemisphaerica]|uniref:uncharacterized protein n=1 Tax=Clytia hemisphaerica TaxID=252671 RepID=UPI0034D7081C
MSDKTESNVEVKDKEEEKTDHEENKGGNGGDGGTGGGGEGDGETGGDTKKGGKDSSQEAYMSYDDIREALTVIGAKNPEKLSAKDLRSYLPYTNGKVTPKDLDMFIKIRSDNRRYEMLTIPDLPQDKILTRAEMQSVGPIELDKRLEVVKGEIKDQARAPIDFSEMKARDWMKVIVNCNMTYGRIFKKLGGDGVSDLAEEPMFFPPNESLFGTPDFKVSQVALSYHQRSELAENFDDKSVMANFNVAASFSTPWVAGSAEYSHEKQNRTVEKNSTVKSVFKVEVPVGVFTLPRPSELEESKIKINDQFKSFVNKYLEDNPKCKRVDVQRAMSERYGDIVPRSVKIGVACYTTKTTTTKEKQNLESVSDSFKASVTASFGCFSGSVSGGKAAKRKVEANLKKTLTHFQPLLEVFQIQAIRLEARGKNGSLYHASILQKGEDLVCGAYRLVIEDDGDLVLKCGPYSNVVWNAGTAKTKASKLKLGVDGNLVLSDPDGNLCWSTDTAGKGIEKFSVLGGGNFVGYKGDDIVWQTDTADKSMYPGATLRPGNKLVNSSGITEVCMEMNGDLVIKYGEGPNKKVVYSSGTKNKAVTGLVFQKDRNLCIYDYNGECVWNAGVADRKADIYLVTGAKNLEGYVYETDDGEKRHFIGSAINWGM